MSGVLTRKDREKPHDLGAASASTLALLRYCTAFACGLAAMFTVAWLLSLPFLIPKKEVYPGVFTRACYHPIWFHPMVCTAGWTATWPSASTYPVQSLCRAATLTGYWESKIMKSLKKWTRGSKSPPLNKVLKVLSLTAKAISDCGILLTDC